LALADGVADMKVKQVEKLVQAHDDATYAYHSRNQNLSPRQLNSRVQIRKRTQSVESKLEDLDRSVRKLKQSGLDGYAYLFIRERIS
jgi:hypothetical protein